MSGERQGRGPGTPAPERVVVLAGGVGGAKAAAGLYQILPPYTLTVIVNTGDDFELLGLPISPDVDTVMYTLAGINHPQQGWGVVNDTFHALEMIGRYGGPTWFRLGDKDLATHIMRRHLRDQGWTLTQVTQHLAQALGIQATILPMSDDPVRTLVITDKGPLPFQEYFVRRRQEPRLLRVEFSGVNEARPTEAVLTAIRAAQAVILAPSNPYLSLDPILALPGMRDLLRTKREVGVAISPIVGGQAIKGPAAKIMRELGEEPSPLVVARRYVDIIAGFVLDERDAAWREAIEALGLRVAMTDTIMGTPEDRARVARVALALAQEASHATS